MRTFTVHVTVDPDVPSAVTARYVADTIGSMRGVAAVELDPPGKPTARELRELQRAVADATTDRPSLSEFLARIRLLHPALAAATEGIYTGAEGRVSEPLADWNRMLCFNWYSNEVRKHFVEWAYIS